MLIEIDGYDFVNEKEAIENINLLFYEELGLELFTPKENLTLKELDVRLYNLLSTAFPENGLPILEENKFEELESLAIDSEVISANEENSADRLFVLLFDIILELYTEQELDFENYSGLKETYFRLMVPETESTEQPFNYYFPDFKIELGYDEKHLTDLTPTTAFLKYRENGIALYTLFGMASSLGFEEESGIVYEGLNIFRIELGEKTDTTQIAIDPVESEEETNIKTTVDSNLLTKDMVGTYVKYDADQDGDLEDEILYRIFKSESIYEEKYSFLYEYMEESSSITEIISEDVLRPGEIRLGVNDNIYDDPNFDMSKVDIIEKNGIITDLEKALYSHQNLVDTLLQHCRELPEAKMVDGITSDVRTICSNMSRQEHSIVVLPEYDTLSRYGLLDTPSGEGFWYAFRHVPITIAGHKKCAPSSKGDVVLYSYSTNIFTSPQTNHSYKAGSGAYGIRPIVVLEPGVLKYSIDNGTGDGSRENPIILQKVPE